MSSSSRTTSKGGKGAKADKSHKSDSGKGGIDKQHRDNQTHSKNEDPVIKEKVKQLIEMSQRTEEEVCLALYECDYDVNLASNMLFESMATGEWEMTVKKKKNRQASTSKQDKAEDGTAGSDDWNEGTTQAGGGGNGGDKDRGRNKTGGPNRLHGRHNDGRGWKGRERQENERNLEDGGGRGEYGRGDRRGRSSGTSRGMGGRGRGGGRAGGRYPPRGGRGIGGGGYNKPIDTWDNTWEGGTGDSGQGAPNVNHNADDNWDDFPGTDEWTTEEYTGSLADTKVFTPSVQPLPETVEATAAVVPPPPLDLGQQGAVPVPSQQSPVPPMVGALTAAQSQYFSQLSQQNNDGKQYGTAQTYQSPPYEKTAATAQVYSNTSQYNSTQQSFANQVANTYSNSGFQPVNSSYTTTQEQPPAQQPPRTKTQRARVPPPSKIPASAVEMPGELNNVGYLDVQFGAMDLIDNNSFDSVGEVKYSGSNTSNLDTSLSNTTNNLDLSSTNQSSTLDAYSSKTNIQSSISTALSQSLSNTDSIPPTSDHLTSTYNSATRTSQAGPAAAPVPATPTALDALGKPTDGHSYPQASTYNTYQAKAGSYSSSYSTAQTTASSYVANQANSYVNSQPANYNTPSGNSYPNSYSSTTPYQSNTNSFPSISQASSSYQSSNQTYPQNTSQSVYGANTGLGSTSNFGSTTTSQYNSYNSSTNHKIGKESSYDNSSSGVNNNQTTSTTNATTSATLSLSQTTISGSKTTTTLAKNSNSAVSNIPPGVTPVMSTPYIMGQVPYFQQPIYSYEDMQLLQQRLPHMTTPYYDVSYQTPTTLAAVRDAAVGYSLSSDGRGGYAAAGRGGDSASPAPNAAGAAGGAAQAPTGVSALAAAQQGHQHQQAVAAAAQPILAAAGTAPPFFYAATAFNTIAPNYAQFGTMYTQLPAATNAHGTNSSTQYPKPGTYGSGYGSYDALNQTQDYSKGGYVASTQSQKGTAGNPSSTGTAGSDLSAMYSKSHTALGKVNSYEKQGFHSGTPPPFTGALHGSQGAGLAPSGTGYAPQVYIPTMAPHSTQLMHQPLHQDSGNTGGQRSQASNQNKSGAKQAYQTSYWNQN